MHSWLFKKLLKYSSLVHVKRGNKWFVDFFPVEVGARGYPAHLLNNALMRLGLPSKTTKETLKKESFMYTVKPLYMDAQKLQRVDM